MFHKLFSRTPKKAADAVSQSPQDAAKSQAAAAKSEALVENLRIQKARYRFIGVCVLALCTMVALPVFIKKPQKPPKPTIEWVDNTYVEPEQRPRREERVRTHVGSNTSTAKERKNISERDATQNDDDLSSIDDASQGLQTHPQGKILVVPKD